MELDFDMCLEQYYRHLYPVDLITKWLAYGKDITHREIAFISKDDVHLRYQSFAAGEREFREALIRRRPQKVDIGAVYNRPPRDRKIALGDFFAVERELVFDIDLTDYDSIRTCCREATMCKKCWRWVVLAMRVLEYLLREHFGFQHMLWVFSGRRGVHCWVADERARRIPSRGREAIAKYLAFDPRGTMVTPRRVHQVAKDACRVIMQSGEFDALVQEQGWLDDEDRWAEVLKLCPEGEARQRLHRAMKGAPTSAARLNLLKQAYDPVTRAAIPVADRLEQDPRVVHARFFELFLLHYAYPKLDEKVTTGLNHLLKSPFCVHPKTGYVAVPLDPDHVEEFRVEQVPRIDKLWMEISKLNKSESKPTDVADVEGGAENNKENQATKRAYLYDTTSMAPYVQTFRTFINAIDSQRKEEGWSKDKQGEG